MMPNHDKITEVLIVGAGPTGLMMACQFAIHHVSFRIIDKHVSPSNNSGAMIVQARSLEIFDQMGVVKEAIKAGIIADKVNLLYNGKIITSTVINKIGGHLSLFPFLLMLEQSITEKLFLKFINDHSHVVERGTRLKSFIQEKEGVTSLLILPDGSEQSIKTKYLIAADGAKSSIRDLLKIPFKGKTYAKPLFILDCKAKTDLNPGEIYLAFSNTSVAAFFPMKGLRWRIDSNLPKKLEKLNNITFDQIEHDFRLWTKVKITFQGYEWFAVSHAHQKYSGSVRKENCFLIGDAAHVNTPVGAQGMNTGLQDAFNLAWKIAFVIKHKAKPEILDTFSSERLGISKGFAHYADFVFKLVTSQNILVVFFRPLLIRLMLKVSFRLLAKRGAFSEMFFKSISQIGIQYRNSILSFKQAEGKFLNGAPRPGDRLPFIELIYNDDKTDNFKILAVESFNLFVMAEDIPKEMKILADKFKVATVLFKYNPETEKLYEILGIQNTGYYLIRPDQYIALRSATLDIQHLSQYLNQFLIIDLQRKVHQ